MSKKPVILWFRRDLRLGDNPAVDAAARSGSPVLPVFVLDECDGHAWDNGGASRWWLHFSLAALNERLVDLGGGQLILRRGNTVEQLEALIEESEAGRLICSRLAGAASTRLEEALAARLADRVELQMFSSQLLHEPGSVRNRDGEPYRVFTAFLRACRELPGPREPLEAPRRMAFPNCRLQSDDLASWALTPTSPDWAGGLRETWTPGEHGAIARMKEFLDVIRNYADDHNRPDIEGTSRLSPHLHFGEVSPRQLWHDVHAFCDPQEEGAAQFLRQLYWREFCHHLLHAYPEIASKPLRRAFTRFPWRHDDRHLDAWQRGMTGYPIVDAGMRELWHTGWMHNRVRMVVASLLVKHLMIPWQDGAAWFHDTLVDADEANNSANWQWVAGCGTDAAPWFRIFNPATQGRKFDPEGRYVRRWVPELAGLDTKWLHAPWEAPDDALRRARVMLDRDYPRPVVDHRTGRERALEAFRRLQA